MSIQFSVRVRIKFDAFYVEPHLSCQYDYLEVRDGESSSSRIIGSKLCGDIAPYAIVSSGPSMTLVFHTDSSGRQTGFKIIAELGKIRLNRKWIWIFSILKNVCFILY